MTRPGLQTRSAERSRPPGLWLLAIGAVAFAIVVALVPPSRARTAAALLLPMITLSGVATRWLRSDALSRPTKAIALGMTVVAATVHWLGSTFPAVIIAVLWGLPLSLATALLAFWAFGGQPAARCRLAVGLTFLATLAPWPLLRADGASGQMMPNFYWLWQAPLREGSEAIEELAVSASHSVTVPAVATASDWPGFRGGEREGVVAGEVAAGLDLEWSDLPPTESWRRTMGRGWSSFAVVGDLACTQDQAGEIERVLCLDARTGQTVWTHEERTRFEETAGGVGPRATPLIHGGRLYALGATGRLSSLEASTGELLWSVDLSAGGAEVPTWGFASSPVIGGGLLYVSPAGAGGLRMLALDARTGEQVWQARGDASGYSTARLALLGGQEQLLLFDGAGLVSYEPGTGESLWEYGWPTDLPRIAQPLVSAGDAVIFGMGYGRGTKSLEVRRNPAGWSVTELWSTTRFKPKFNDFVIRDGYIFGLDEGILVCLDSRTGERLWKGGRYGYGQLLLVDGVLVVLTESGDLVLVEAATAGHRELARAPALTGKTWNHPTIANGRLLVRNGSEAAAYDLSAR